MDIPEKEETQGIMINDKGGNLNKTWEALYCWQWWVINGKVYIQLSLPKVKRWKDVLPHLDKIWDMWLNQIHT